MMQSERIVAVSAAMREVLDQAEALAPFADVPVLIGGESGTGKEVVARFLHRRGPRAKGPFVAVNAAAIPDTLLESELFGHARGAFTGAQFTRKGFLEEADDGTLFLDEVGDLSPRAQSVLLRALQEREYRRVGEVAARRSDFRLVTATHKDLEVEVARGSVSTRSSVPPRRRAYPAPASSRTARRRSPPGALFPRRALDPPR